MQAYAFSVWAQFPRLSLWDTICSRRYVRQGKAVPECSHGIRTDFSPWRNQHFSAIGPVIEIFAYYPVLIEGEAVGILDTIIIVDDFKSRRFSLPVHKSKRLIRKFISFERFSEISTNHFPHKKQRIDYITFSCRICAVNWYNRHKLFFPSGEISSSFIVLSAAVFMLMIAASLIERWFVTENWSNIANSPRKTVLWYRYTHKAPSNQVCFNYLRFSCTYCE